MNLLAQFREPKAYPLIIDFLEKYECYAYVVEINRNKKPWDYFEFFQRLMLLISEVIFHKKQCISQTDKI